MGTLTLDDVLKVEDLPVEDVPMPKWGGSIGARTLRADERAECERIIAKSRQNGSSDPALLRRTLLRFSLVNPDGSAFLKDDAAAKSFMQKNASDVETLVEKVMELAGFRKKDAEELEKN